MNERIGRPFVVRNGQLFFVLLHAMVEMSGALYIRETWNFNCIFCDAFNLSLSPWEEKGGRWVGNDNLFSFCVLSRSKNLRLIMGDHLVLISMKNIVICGNWCELWNFVSIVFLNENFSMDTHVSMLHLFQYIIRTICIYYCWYAMV